MAKVAFPLVSPAPIRASFEFGLGYIWLDGRGKSFSPHPNADLWLPAPAACTRIAWEFGIIQAAYERKDGTTDGVEFTVTSLRPGAAPRVIFQRMLEPATRVTDRGTQQEVISFESVSGEMLRFSTTPGQSRSFDWPIGGRIEVK
ncbi:MAG: hypothetical protein WDM96_02805 [Lacunisphaera sp.]